MTNVTMHIKNVNEIKRALDAAPQIMAKYIQKAIGYSILILHGDTVNISNFPVDTGLMRGTMQESFYPMRGEFYPVVDYAGYVHEGTRYMRARPFLEWGLNKSEAKINNYFELALRDGLEEISRKAH